MSDGRKRLSGSEYRKIKCEKQKKVDETIKSSRKVSEYFQRTTIATSSSTLPALLENTSEFEQKKPIIKSSLNTCNFEKNIGHVDSSQSEILSDALKDVIGVEGEHGKSDPEHHSSKRDESTSAMVIPVNQYSNISNDPADWIKNDDTIAHLLKRGINQNLDVSFSNSKKVYPDKSTRYLTESLFRRKLVNGEIRMRYYLVYSVKKGAVFCAPCKLFGNEENQFTSEGFSDWKHGEQRLNSHENSDQHKRCEVIMLKRTRVVECIDATLKIHLEKEICYWQNVLRRVVAVVKKLSSRGLAFRGSEEKFGSFHNGNFMMTLELISEFDPFLADHIARYGNTGSGNTSYLSKTICGEVIDLLAEKTRKKIIEEVKENKYYSISVDSTPDISNVDQLTFVLRYTTKTGIVVERFLCFLPNTGHTSEELAETIVGVLNSNGIDLKNCRGQSYDNANNMSGQYNGLQARIKNLNNLADYVPCSAHSLNLIGVHAAECCSEAIKFFDTVQNIYNFFSSSTQRWAILSTHLEQGNNIKSLSETRWAARASAVSTLYKEYRNIFAALKEFICNKNVKPEIRCKAEGLMKNLKRFETAYLSTFWSTILERFNSVSKRLQDVDICLSDVVELYESLRNLIQTNRELFDMYERKACEISISGTNDYSKVIRKRKMQYDETREGEVAFTPRDKFKIQTFLTILDRLSTELATRCISYKNLSTKFTVLNSLHNQEINGPKLIEEAKNLKDVYMGDLDDDKFVHECIHFHDYLKTYEFSNNGKSKIMQMLNLIREKSLENIFPNIDIALRIYLSLFVTNCTGERLFSALRRIKNYLRSTQSQEKLNSLGLLNIEAELVQTINFDDVIVDFAVAKARRKPFN